LNLSGGRFACQNRRQPERLPYNLYFSNHEIGETVVPMRVALTNSSV
jgi:hypothetical protein